MVSANSKRKVGDVLPTTRCTNCHTVFELPPELLESTDTRVRCGECLCIFDARDGLIKGDADSVDATVEPAKAPRGKKTSSKKKAKKQTRKTKATVANPSAGADDNSALDVTYSDFDLFSEEADLPALAYLDETRDTPEFDFDAVELGEEETFSDTLFSHDVTIDADMPITEGQGAAGGVSGNALTLPRADVDFAVDKAPEEPLIFNYVDPPDAPAETEKVADAKAKAQASRDTVAQKAERAQAKHNRSHISTTANPDDDEAAAVIAPELALETAKARPGGAWVWVGGILLLVGVLFATVVYPRWKSLDQSQTFRPMKLAVCSVFKCRVDTRVDPSKLTVLRREVFEAQDRDNALSISITIKNTAEFAQRFPVVEARMTDRIGRTVAQRAFKPSDYLTDWERGDVLSASETVDINLTVNDPGAAAEHHVLQLRELRLDCDPIEASDGRQRWPVDCAEL